MKLRNRAALALAALAISTAINPAGQEALREPLPGTTDATPPGLSRGDGTILPKLARDKDLAAGGGNSAPGFGYPYITSIGQVPFTANVTGTADGSTVGI